MSPPNDFIARFDALDDVEANRYLYECLVYRRDWLYDQLVDSRPVLEFLSFSPDNPTLIDRSDLSDFSGKAYFITGPEQVEHALRNWSMRHHRYSGRFILSIDDEDEHYRKRRTLVEKLNDPAIALKMDSAVELGWMSLQAEKVCSGSDFTIDVLRFARNSALHFTAGYFGIPASAALHHEGLAKWSFEAFREYIWKIHARHFVEMPPSSRAAFQYIQELIRGCFYTAPSSSVIGRFRSDPGAFIRDNGLMDEEAIGSNIIGCIQGLIDNVATSACYALNQFYSLSRRSGIDSPFTMAQLRDSAAGTSVMPLEQYVFLAHQHDTPAPFLPRFASSERVQDGTDIPVPEGAHVSCAIGPAVRRIDPSGKDRDAHDCRMGIGMHDCIGRYLGDQLVTRILRKLLLVGDIAHVNLQKEWGWIVTECMATVRPDQSKSVSPRLSAASRRSMYVDSGAAVDHPNNRPGLEALMLMRPDDISCLTCRELRNIPPATFNLLSSCQLREITPEQISKLDFMQCMALDTIFRNRSDVDVLEQQKTALELRISFYAVMSRTSAAKSRPHAYSLWSSDPDSFRIHDYVTWPGLVDKRYFSRHLPPVTEEVSNSLPSVLPYGSVTEPGNLTGLFKYKAEWVEESRSSLLFAMFAQWFTDSFMNTDRLDRRKTRSSHQVDMCQIYGESDDVAIMLREHKGGRLKQEEINGNIFPPRLFDRSGNVKAEFRDLPYVLNGHVNEVIERWGGVFSRKKNFLASGLSRGNATFGNAAMNTLFLREHNRLCDLLANKNPHWDDERLFQTVRLIVILLELKIVISEYINHIASPADRGMKAAARRIFRFDNSYAEQQAWYRANHISLEFNLLYRWHSLVPISVSVADKEYQLEEYVNFNDPLINHGLDAVLHSASAQRINTASLFSTPDRLLRAEYEALKMSRDFRVQSFNAYRKYFGLDQLNDLDELGCRSEVVDKLKQVYPGGIAQLDLLVGLYAERSKNDEVFGELMTRMVAHDAFTQVLTSPLLSKNVLGEQTITKTGLQALEETNTLNDLWKRNSDCSMAFGMQAGSITMDYSRCPA